MRTLKTKLEKDPLFNEILHFRPIEVIACTGAVLGTYFLLVGIAILFGMTG